MRRIIGLDVLRFIAAVWVALSHGANLPLREMLGKESLPTLFVTALNNMAFNGVAAVVVFFLISGMCIHLPHRHAHRIELAPYLTRRMLRVGLPLLAGGAIVGLLGGSAPECYQAVLWSLYCELAFYLAYPVLHRLFRRFGIPACITTAYLVAVIVIAVFDFPLYPWAMGPFTWLVWLPSWLLGCLLADRMTATETSGSVTGLIYWRCGAWILTFAATLVMVHAPIKIGAPITMNAFALYAYLWLGRELHRFARIGQPLIPAAIGSFAFSLYLVHFPTMTLVKQALAGSHPLAVWAAQIAAIIAVTAAFFLLVERPSHQLAHRLSKACMATS
ncbi:acyltransferase [Azospirillum sp. A1-3]|uniref:acyltransferase family protein n=1 Tax=Azospirillum sp. A1-3 TaxID=185874 RepID=UPI0020774232|nr:acyltransferase [Azospirillum sp. A1-3]